MATVSRRIMKPHKFTANGNTYLIKLADVYDSQGSTVGSAMGISKLADTYEPSPGDVQITSVSDGIQAGLLGRVVISYRDTDTGKTYTSKIVCPIDKMSAALTALLSKTFDSGKNVFGARVPRRRRLG